ncbi:MAG TPA: FAD-dependent oxidoreductase, partial [Methanoregula sp.]|nr:FAD-dependent oxidoreductase [Methanoregula sp.]
NITVLEHTHVTAIQGDKFLTGITVQNDSGAEQQLSLDGVFVEIGWLPNAEILDGFVEINDRNEVVVDINCRTSRPGVFAAGDITNAKSKQIIIAAGDGAKAALEAYEYVMTEWKK